MTVLAFLALWTSGCGRGDDADVQADSGPLGALVVDADGDKPAVLVVIDDGDDISAPIDAGSSESELSDSEMTEDELAEPEPALDTSAAVAPTTTTAPPRSSGVPLVIFETDMGPDIDDALGLAMLHGYAKLGLIEIAAVTISRNSEASARYTDALNTFYGRPDIPIAINRHASPYFDDRQNYVRLADSLSYDVTSEQIEDGYILQRRVMADALSNGRDLLLIQTGFSGNVSRLLNSSGDSISPKSGIELARDAVSEFSIMAGALDMSLIEFNIEKDVAPARNVFAKWPGALALSPFELGYHIHYPYSAIKSELAWMDNHPIRRSYEWNDLDWHQDAPPFYNMRSWDLTSIIHAIEPESDYFLTSGRGTVSVNGEGRTSFALGSGQHYVLDRGRQYSQQQRQRVVDRMVELVSMRP